MSEQAKFIGLTGTNASGKGEAASFFQARGYDYFSLSDVIRDELRLVGLPLNRDNLIRKGNQLRSSQGPDVLARRIVERLKGNAVIDSIRNPREIAYLRRQAGFILLAIDAPAEVRYQRALLRGRDESAATLEEFMEKEREEMTGPDGGQQLLNCMAEADYTVINDGALEDFYKKLESFL
jgi:dephospho-CoA kinase